MLGFVLRRAVQFVPTFLGATFLAFAIIHLAPGDFTQQFRPNILDQHAQRQLDRLREQLALDQPFPIQYARWIQKVVTEGYLGESFSTRAPVAQTLRRPIQNSVILVATSLVLIYAIGIPLGVFAAVRQYTVGDSIVSTAAFFGLSIPNFFQTILMILVAYKIFQWTGGTYILPTGQMTSLGHGAMTPVQQVLDVLWHMTVPVLVLVTSGAAGPMRYMRGQMLEFLKSDFVRTARAKGLGERAVLYKHTLRNAILPFIATVGAILPALFSGAGLVEVVFGWPGLTPVALDAIGNTDLYVLMGLITIGTVLLIIGNLLSDILLAMVDPRIRFS